MSAGRRVEIGQRYRAVSAVGAGAALVWTVTKVFRPWPGGLEHVCLQSIETHSRSMTFAASVIADKARFARVE
jgi:hypothetical protein